MSYLSSIQPIKVKNSTMVIMVDQGMEYARAALYSRLLIKFGTCRKAPTFDFSKYKALDPFDRCFDNAMETALKYDLTYMEGLLMLLTESNELFPVAHGWCEDRNRQIVDATCSKNQEHPSALYYGLPIKTAYSLDWHKRVGYYGCLDGDKDGRPIGVHHEPSNLWLDAMPDASLMIGLVA